MDWKSEAKDIVNDIMPKDMLSATTYLLKSIIEVADLPGVTISDVKQLIYDMIEEIENPKEEIEEEDPICEVSSKGLFDS